jgi:hypothetical protein
MNKLEQGYKVTQEERNALFSGMNKDEKYIIEPEGVEISLEERNDLMRMVENNKIFEKGELKEVLQKVNNMYIAGINKRLSMGDFDY